jgi:hypothetical protein
MQLLQRLTAQRPSTWVHLITLAASLLLVSSIFVAYDVLTLRDRALQRLMTEAEMIGRNAAPALLSADRDAAALALKGLRAERQILAAGIFGADGVIFAGYGLYDPSDASTLVNSSKGDGHRFIGDRLLVYRAIDVGDENVGSVRLLWAMEGIGASLLRHLGVAAVVFMIAMPVSLFLLTKVHEPDSATKMEPARADVASRQSAAAGPKATAEQPAIDLPARASSQVWREAGDDRGPHEIGALAEPEPRRPRQPVPSTPAAPPSERNEASTAQLIRDLLEVVESHRAAAEAKNVRLQLGIDPRAVVIVVDPQGLKQILRILLSNAVESAPEGTRLEVVARRVGSHIEIAVSDSGAGGARRPFLSVATAGGRLERGVSVVRRLAELHGGRLRVDHSDERRTLTVELPIASSLRPAKPKEGSGNG